MARANIDRAGVGDRVEVLVGPALETLPTVTEGPFDLVFIDADKENNAGYLEWALRLTHPGSVIVVDNVIREGAILSSDPDDVVRGLGGRWSSWVSAQNSIPQCSRRSGRSTGTDSRSHW